MIVGEDHKGGKKQEYEERGGGMSTECGVEEEVPRPIRRWAEERDELFLSCVLKFERGS